MSGKEPSTESNLRNLTLGVLLSTPKAYVNIDNAVNSLKLFLEKEIDEPIILFYDRQDANALQISKVFSGIKRGLNKAQVSSLPINSTFILNFYYECGEYKSFLNEILCRRFPFSFNIDTKLKATYVKS